MIQVDTDSKGLTKAHLMSDLRKHRVIEYMRAQREIEGSCSCAQTPSSNTKTSRAPRDHLARASRSLLTVETLASSKFQLAPRLCGRRSETFAPNWKLLSEAAARGVILLSKVVTIRRINSLQVCDLSVA